jgi:hypothetical protein
MEIDIEQLILKAAALRMGDMRLGKEKYFITTAFEELYPEVDIVQRVRQQVKEYKKLTMWEE